MLLHKTKVEYWRLEKTIRSHTNSHTFDVKPIHTVLDPERDGFGDNIVFGFFQRVGLHQKLRVRIPVPETRIGLVPLRNVLPQLPEQRPQRQVQHQRYVPQVQRVHQQLEVVQRAQLGRDVHQTRDVLVVLRKVLRPEDGVQADTGNAQFREVVGLERYAPEVAHGVVVGVVEAGGEYLVEDAALVPLGRGVARLGKGGHHGDDDGRHRDETGHERPPGDLPYQRPIPAHEEVVVGWVLERQLELLHFSVALLRVPLGKMQVKNLEPK